ncbi:TPA: hypothetical protein I8438_000164 [Serratia marcescens]|uniref:Uncharacterized protein n=1 Tax=Serratia marcescens TaxID=615 RepID=A0AB33FY32_SERMA|nr:hypothetical protein [Serratia marcescens]AKL42639.1 hypothetical protein AB188_19715 [Serratia marcescens]AWL69953.1 hypothetical protein DKC05_21030 [Serratia marcescens]MDP8606563.1 hypothetical protein [Serratia marcescens]MDP8875191.1 hypothetical protein [Serratia marcescens]HAT2208471.1 hypothetical protein [Serratia marcescens]
MNTHTVILDKLRHSVAHPTLHTFLFYAIIALILIKAMGYSGGKGIDILFIALILLLLSIHSLTRYGLIIPFILLCALYAPVGAIYGSPSAVVVSALLQSNPIEAREFLQTLPVSCYLLPIAILVTPVILGRFIWRSPPVKENNIDRIGPAYDDYYRQSIQRWGE